MERRSLKTERLELIAGDLELLEAAMLGREALERRLEASVPSKWPPEPFDMPEIESSAAYLKENPGSIGWRLWYLIDRASQPPGDAQSSMVPTISPGISNESGTGETATVGIAGFKGGPSEDGTVEVGYSILDQFRGRGFATEALAALLDWAFVHRAVKRVIAETPPPPSPAIRVLEKSGFRSVGSGSKQGIIRHELLRADHAAARLKALHERNASEAPDAGDEAPDGGDDDLNLLQGSADSEAD